MLLAIHYLAWSIISFGFWANPAQTIYPPSQIGVIRYVSVGKLDCGGRLNDLAHLQTWCSKDGKVIRNEVADISAFSSVTTSFFDNKPGEVDAAITWLVAYVEGNPQTVGYQVSYQVGGAPEKTISGQF